MRKKIKTKKILRMNDSCAEQLFKCPLYAAVKI